jgi:hypothetical protein
MRTGTLVGYFKAAVIELITVVKPRSSRHSALNRRLMLFMFPTPVSTPSTGFPILHGLSFAAMKQ